MTLAVGVRPAVWAPIAESVDIVVDGHRQPMSRGRDGWFESATALAHGTRYAYSVDGADPTPDPRSVWLPDGVHGATAVYDHSGFRWTDSRWLGVALRDAVLYELHVGTFTSTGTLQSAVERLPHLVELGVTHVEVMPVCAFDGDRGWGYDGTAPWSVAEPYGGPDGLKTFVDAAHHHGLAVILDVVHNHLGPSGNYLARYGPYFTEAHHTPWGPAVNLDQPASDQVRDYLRASVRSWLHDFHLDGLRLDAVHELHDHRAMTFLEQLSADVDAMAVASGRHLHLIAESDRNDPRTVLPSDRGGIGIHAQWDDDVHHGLHCLLTGEEQGYYADFAADPVRALQRTLDVGFFHAGTYSSFRGRLHGRPVDPEEVAASQLVASLQTHDQVGNRALGDRLAATLSPAELAAGAALLLMSPFTPMLFMGEEWGASTPWQFFTSYTDPALARAVTEGRRREFAAHGWGTTEVPDPQDPATFAASRLSWAERRREPHASLLQWYTDLLALRRERRASGRRDGLGQGRLHCSDDGSVLRMDLPGLCVVINRGAEPRDVGAVAEAHARPEAPADPATILLSFGPASVAAGTIHVDAGSTAVVQI